MDWIWPALWDCVCAMERRSRRSSVSWVSRAELFFWDWEIWVRSQRISAAKIMATITRTEFMGYYFTRTVRNSPPTAAQKKEHGRMNSRLTSRRAGAQRCCAPSVWKITRLALGRIGIGGG